MKFLTPKELYEKRDNLIEDGYEPVRIRFGRSTRSGARTVGVDFEGRGQVT